MTTRNEVISFIHFGINLREIEKVAPYDAVAFNGLDTMVIQFSRMHVRPHKEKKLKELYSSQLLRIDNSGFDDDSSRYLTFIYKEKRLQSFIEIPPDILELWLEIQKEV